jgi:glucosylceramidase
MRAALLSLTVASLLAACAGGGSEQPEPVLSGMPVQVWLTTGDKTRLLARQPDVALHARESSTAAISVDPAQRFQTMAGFGASITDATAWLITNRMSAAQRDALMRELFGRGEGGIGFDLTRLTIGASDFSRTHYSLNDRPPGQTDLPLAHFSIEPNRADVLPVIRQALAINPKLQVMASPWSAPGWMKTTDSLVKGTLKPEFHDAFARYLVRYVDAMAAEGVPIFALTLQNEPHFEPGDYPGMRLDPAQRAALIGRRVGPLLAQRQPPVQIIEWDHNWDEPQSPLAVLADPVARPYVSGVGWHCYAGDVKAQSVVHEAHPDKDTWFTECSGGNWKPHWPETLPWMMRNLVIGSVRHWSRGVLMWNLALDEKHGPRLGGCPDCRGVVTIDSGTGAVTRNMEYYAFGHASKFVRRDAQRIGSTAAIDGIDQVAFRNADDGSLVVVVCNSAPAARRIALRHGDRVAEFEMPRESVATFVWAP